MSAPQIRRALFRWYKKHRRDLPWRRTKNPYHILVSEIMLQQTQVDRVIPKYKAFLRSFPTIKKLAEASTADVIRAWKGLGYNRRALFLQKTARAIREHRGGRFPRVYDELIALPGVGDYTARAILSFAYEQPVPMMDTNHRRFYQRVLFGLRTKKDVELLDAAEDVLPKKRAYDWNQSLMDFGSLVCTTRKPACEACPLKTQCAAYPEILTVVPEEKKRRKVIPFKQTDRYLRGQIMDMLREEHAITRQKVYVAFKSYGRPRLEKVVDGLKRDGLISVKGTRILLPS